MSFLAGLAASVVEWLLTKLFAVFQKDYQEWAAKRKSDAALASNQAALAAAIKSGDKDAIAQAGQDSLNNGRGN